MASCLARSADAGGAGLPRIRISVSGSSASASISLGSSGSTSIGATISPLLSISLRRTGNTYCRPFTRKGRILDPFAIVPPSFVKVTTFPCWHVSNTLRIGFLTSVTAK